MKITAVKSFVVGSQMSPDGWTRSKPFVFVKVETDEGLIGWGEAYALNFQEGSIALLVEELGRQLLGSDPLAVRDLAANAFTRLGDRRAGLSFYAALSGIELALWDITGKHRQLPVYRLLGGPCQQRVRLYANFWSTEPHSTEAIVEHAVEMVERGFGAIKIYPFLCPTIDAAVQRVAAVRAAIGPDIDLAIDLSGREDPQLAAQAIPRFREFDPYWIEEPVASHDLYHLAKFTADNPEPIVSGERLCGMYTFREMLERRAANMINPDITACGGLQTMLDIIAMATAYAVPVSPHNYNSNTLGLATCLQVAALSPNCPITEYFPYFQPVSDAISQGQLVIEDGYAQLPEAPGLGIELDEDALIRHADGDGIPYRINN